MKQRGFQVGGEEGDLFCGTAPYYARYRRPYARPVIEWLVGACGLQSRDNGRLLDVGCGTGLVFQALAPYFNEVLAVEPDAEMLEHAAEVTRKLGFQHVALRQMRAEALDATLGEFRLVVFGASFHWTDRALVTELVFDRLVRGGHLVVMASGSLYTGGTPWETALQGVVQDWLGADRRAGGGVFQRGAPHGEVIGRSRFGTAERMEIKVDESWSLDEIVGYLYSTSCASQVVLGLDKVAGFEEDLRKKLAPLSTAGVFQKQVSYEIWIASKR